MTVVVEIVDEIVANCMLWWNYDSWNWKPLFVPGQW